MNFVWDIEQSAGISFSVILQIYVIFLWSCEQVSLITKIYLFDIKDLEFKLCSYEWVGIGSCAICFVRICVIIK